MPLPPLLPISSYLISLLKKHTRWRRKVKKRSLATKFSQYFCQWLPLMYEHFPKYTFSITPNYLIFPIGCKSKFHTVQNHKGKQVKCTLVQALRLCTGRTAHRGSRGIALPYHDHGTRRGWEISVTPRPLFTPGKDSVIIVQEAGWAPGPVWTGAENLAPPGFDPRTVQPVANRYTDWTIRPTTEQVLPV